MPKYQRMDSKVVVALEFPRARFRDSEAHGIPKVFLIGRMRAVGLDGEDILPRARKAQAVLAFLCLERGERVSRNRIAGVIWDRSGDAQARDSLRKALFEIEKSLK